MMLNANYFKINCCHVKIYQFTLFGNDISHNFTIHIDKHNSYYLEA